MFHTIPRTILLVWFVCAVVLAGAFRPAGAAEFNPVSQEVSRLSDSSALPADPLGLTEEGADDEGVDPADELARQAATELRQLALREVAERRRVIAAQHNEFELNQFNQLLVQGNFVYESENGTAKVRMIDGDYAVKVTLSADRFPRTRKTVFLIFSLESLRPDPKRVGIFLSVLQKKGELPDGELREILSDETKFETFVLKVAREQGHLSAEEVRDGLKSSSAELRQYLAALMLSSDVQALGLRGEEVLYAFYGKKPRFFSREYWRTWFDSVRSAATAGSVTLGLICGTVQGAATYWMASEAIQMAAQNGMVPNAVFPLEWVPALAAAWSYSYGLALASYNGFYRKVVYRGGPGARLFKLSIFGATFGYVYKLLTEYMELFSVAGQRHFFTNLFANQYAKDDAYRVARIRESLRLNQHEFVIPLKVPQLARTLFPRLFKRLPDSIVVKQADVETQGSYHVLWAFKMLHFVHLVPVAVLPAAIVLARGCAYGYLGYLYATRSWDYSRVPMPEKERQLEEIRRHLADLNRSWLDVVRIPVEVVRSIRRGLTAVGAKSRELVVRNSRKRRPGSCFEAYQGLNRSVQFRSS